MRSNIALITLISCVIAVNIKTEQGSSVGSDWDMLSEADTNTVFGDRNALTPQQSEIDTNTIFGDDNALTPQQSEIDTNTIFGDDNALTPQQSEADFTHEDMRTLVSRTNQDTEGNPTGK
jgi:hypothetical protein